MMGTLSGVVSLALVAVAAGADLPVVTFDGKQGTTFTWRTEDDPVMGGQSVSKISIDNALEAAVWQGQVKIVPFLRAPGFCTCRTEGAKLPSLESFAEGGLSLQVRSVPGSTNLTTFQLQITSSQHINPRGGQFQADFDVVPSTQVQSVYVPFSKFVESWRGERVGGAPSAEQLSKLTQIGLGAAGKAGIFDVELHSITATTTPPQPAMADSGITLVDFVADSKTNYVWTDLNDPVMGGRSTSSFKKDDATAIGIFDGTVRIVPQLQAPGFCNSEARSVLSRPMPDASSTLGGGLVYTVKSSGNLSSFKAAFGTWTEYNFGSYKADFTVPNDGQIHDVYIPYTNFSNKWSASTGEPTIKCSAVPAVCPNKKALSTLGSVGVWAEGAAGDFHLEIHRIAAVATPPSL